MTYLIARAACGCIQAATDVNINDVELGEMVLDWMRRNLTVERVTDAPRLGLCPLHTELAEKDAEIKRLRAANADELDKQIEISTRELVETTLSFCNMVSGAINCYEDGTIKDLMKELSAKARDTATRVMAYTDVRDSHRK